MKIGKGFGLITFTALLIVLLIFSISITQSYVSDTDASTYVIVPMLMLPIFAVFMLKNSERMVPRVDNRSVVLGTVLFLIFIAMILDLRAYLGPLFFSYRINTLLLPVAIAALATLIFGIKNLGKFAWIAVYALFASPLILIPVINMNLNFASVNSLLIYYSTAALFHGLTFVSPITLAYGGNQISIGNSCIGIGALIALVFFMLPIAYFLKGGLGKKLLWILSGFLLMLFLNFMRMLLITVAWFTYGPSQSILNVHAIAGQIIFYGIILLMIILVGKYGLSYPKIGLGKKRLNYSSIGITTAIILSILYFLISMSYSGSSQVSLNSIAQNATFNWRSISTIYSSYLSYNGTSSSVLGSGNRSVAIAMGNQSNISAVAIFGQNGTAMSRLDSNRSLVGWKEYLHEGNIAYLYEFDTVPNISIYYSSVVYPQGQGRLHFGMYVVRTGPANGA